MNDDLKKPKEEAKEESGEPTPTVEVETETSDIPAPQEATDPTSPETEQEEEGSEISPPMPAPTEAKLEERGIGSKKLSGHIVISKSEDPRAKWYVVHTTSGHEVRVAESLRQRIETMGLTEKVFELLIPTQDRVVIRSGRKVTIKEKITSAPAARYKVRFSLGEEVKITDGPFAEFLGTINEMDEDKGKVKVMVSIFGRETPVELDFLQIAKV